MFHCGGLNRWQTTFLFIKFIDQEAHAGLSQPKQSNNQLDIIHVAKLLIIAFLLGHIYVSQAWYTGVMN